MHGVISGQVLCQIYLLPFNCMLFSWERLQQEKEDADRGWDFFANVLGRVSLKKIIILSYKTRYSIPCLARFNPTYIALFSFSVM